MPIMPEMSIIPAREWTGRTGQRRGWRIRKETKDFRRRLRGILVKKGCKESGVRI